jgi:D-alanine-D-alanine ligase
MTSREGPPPIAGGADGTVFGKVAVLMGGRSAEREISLKSGRAVLAALRRRDVDAHGIDAGQEVLEQLTHGGFARAFIALHGRGGEDGTLQGALEILGLPYTGTGVLGSALGMDKRRCKQLWQAAGIPTPAHVMLPPGFNVQAVVETLSLPLMVKPVHEGSSLGMTKVSHPDELVKAWERAVRFDKEVIAERWIGAGEYTGAVLGTETLPLIRLETSRDFYDYAAKYTADSTRYRCPCGLGGKQEHALRELVWEAFTAVGARGWGRVDFLLDEQGHPWFIEVNTVPGMTDHSLVPMAARAAGIDFDELVIQILASSLTDSVDE